MKRSFRDYIPIFKVNIDAIVTETLKNKGIQQQIIDLNQSQMYDEGIDSKGERMKTISGDPYTVNTIQIKQDKGQITSHVTLYDEGYFYRSMKVKELQNGIEIEADFTKGGDDIRDNFEPGFDPLGVTKESLLKLKEWLFLDLFGQLLRKSLGL